MNETPLQKPHRRWRHAYHLFWALPVSLIVCWFPLVLATLSWCGISGCSGGGFGRISDPNIVAAVGWLVVCGVVAAIPLAVIPWTQNRALRFGGATLFAVVVALIGLGMIAP